MACGNDINTHLICNRVHLSEQDWLILSTKVIFVLFKVVKDAILQLQAII